MSIGNIAMGGLNASMTNMESISNNIANVNTLGFKKSYVNFSDIYLGGFNQANQAGAGVRIQSIQQDFSGGQINSTDRGLDVSLSKDGFFVQRNPGTGLTSYTRAGRLDVDNSGYLTNLGGRMQGYPAVNGTILATGNLVDLKIPTTPVAAKPSANANFTLNLNSTATPPLNPFSNTDPTSYNYRTDTIIYDSLGNPGTLTAFYIRQPDSSWQTQVLVNDTNVGTGSLTFTNEGVLSSASGLNNLSWVPGSGAVSPQTFSLNLAGSTQYANGDSSQILSQSQDGYQAGMPLGFTIDNNGMLQVYYSNNQTQVQGQIAVATFASPQNLSRSDDMSWLATAATGNPLLNPSSSTGAINPNSIELSNVDLTEELVNLLGAQHDFQANAQVEQTYNQLLQTIENL